MGHLGCGRLVLAEAPGPRHGWRGRGLGVFPDDFRRTAASSILKWVVSQRHCLGSKAQSRREEAASDGDPGSQKGERG